MSMNDRNSLSHTKWKYHIAFAPKIAVSSFMGYLKGKSSTMLYEQFGEQLAIPGFSSFTGSK